MAKKFKEKLIEYYTKDRNKEYIVIRSNGHVYTLRRHQGFLEREGGRIPNARVLKVFNDRVAARNYIDSLDPPKKKVEAPGDPAGKTNQRRIKLQKRINALRNG